MPKSSKTQFPQKISHPRSRKVLQITKQLKRKSNLKKSKLVNYVKQNVTGEKLIWFRDHLEQGVIPYTPDLTMKLIELYLSRFDEELEQIKMKHNIGNRKNRQHASREDVILLTKLHEKEEFHTCGLEIPDLLNPKQLEMLIKWEGELRFLQNFKLKRYSLKQLQGLANRAGTGKSVSARVSENEAASKNVEMTEGTEDSGNTKVLLESEDYNKIEVQESEGSDSQNEKKSDVNEVEGHPNDKNQISESTGMEVDS